LFSVEAFPVTKIHPIQQGWSANMTQLAQN